MATTVSGADWKSAPEDYAALHRIYYPFMVNLVAKNGIDDNNKEDVASEIFLRFMERGLLEDFDPDLVFEYQGEPRPARFKSFLARAVSIYVRSHYDRQTRLNTREVKIFDMQMQCTDGRAGFGTPDGSEATWGEHFGNPHADHADDVIELVMEEQDARGIRQWLAQRPRRSINDICDLVAVYDAVRAQLLDLGEYDVERLQQKFNISNTTMHNWLWWLKANLAVAYGKQLPPKRRRTVRPKGQS